jgi:hypothetical protein
MTVLEDGVSEISLRQALENGTCPNCGKRGIDWKLGKIEDAIIGKHCDREFTINVMDSSVTVGTKVVQPTETQTKKSTPEDQLKLRESELSKAYSEASTKDKAQIKPELDEIKEAKKK